MELLTKDNASGGPSPKISVVIPIYNGERTIERCLEAVLAQDVACAYEVIVADSSDDRTAEIVAAKFPSVRLVQLDERAFPGTARNEGIRIARGDYIALTDADCLPDRDWLARILAAHEGAERYDAVGGAICDGTPGSASGLIGYLLEFREFIPVAPRRNVITIPTANICYRREVFDQFGMFDDVRASEDMLFNWRISLGGGRILFDPAIRVTHLNRTGWKTVIGYQGVLGRHSAAARHRMDPPFEVIRAYPALGWLMPWLMRFPLLGVLIPFVRLGRALVWLATHDLRTFAKLVVLSPGYLAGAWVWSSAFVHALREERLPAKTSTRSGGAAKSPEKTPRVPVPERRP